MATTMIQYVFKPNPGADLEAIIGVVREAAKLWGEAGAATSLWNVQIGEVGNLVFAVRADSAAQMGSVLEKVNANPAFAAWRVRSIKSGLTSWVRSNQASEIAL